MLRPRGNLPPALAIQQPRDRRFMHRLVHLCFKRIFETTEGRQLSSRCTLAEGLDASLLFCNGQILMAATTDAWGFECTWSTPFIESDNLMDKRNGDPKIPCNRCRRSWINQRRVTHSPFLVRPEIDGCA
jgi:hypothetical protein